MEHSLKTVADVMRPGVLSVSESSTLRAVAQVMHEHRVHGVLVVADDGELLGWVTARGLLAHRDEDWRRIKAGKSIGEPCVRVVPSATVSSAIETMAGTDATRLVVVRPGSHMPDGVVSDLDLVAYLAR
jgi:CBS domain-containing protein